MRMYFIAQPVPYPHRLVEGAADQKAAARRELARIDRARVSLLQSVRCRSNPDHKIETNTHLVLGALAAVKVHRRACTVARYDFLAAQPVPVGGRWRACRLLVSVACPLHHIPVICVIFIVVSGAYTDSLEYCWTTAFHHPRTYHRRRRQS